MRREDLFPFSSLDLTIFVRRGRRGASIDELGRSSDELALDCCIRSRLLTRIMRCFVPSLLMPFSRLLRLDEDLLLDTVDDSLLTRLRLTFGADVVDDVVGADDVTLEFLGRLSIDDCDDATYRKHKFD